MVVSSSVPAEPSVGADQAADAKPGVVPVLLPGDRMRLPASAGILSPGIAWLVLQFFPVIGVFAVAGLALLAAWLVAGKLHPELGVPGAERLRGRTGGDPGA